MNISNRFYIELKGIWSHYKIKIMIDLTLNSDLSFGSGKNNNNADFRILASGLSVSYDFLIFTDSK